MIRIGTEVSFPPMRRPAPGRGTERAVQEALPEMMVGRTAFCTAFCIAPRLSTIQDVDRIVGLHHGRVRESGTHAELLARGGIYARLYRLQYRDQEAPVGCPARPAGATPLSSASEPQ